jgi:hypothetical protein
MTLRAHPRRKRHLLAPFEGNGKFQQLTVEDFAMSEVSDAAWDQYAGDRNKDALTTKRTLFFRSIFVPSLACALSPARAGNGEAVATFAETASDESASSNALLRANHPSVQEEVIMDRPELSQTRDCKYKSNV